MKSVFLTIALLVHCAPSWAVDSESLPEGQLIFDGAEIHNNYPRSVILKIINGAGDPATVALHKGQKVSASFPRKFRLPLEYIILSDDGKVELYTAASGMAYYDRGYSLTLEITNDGKVRTLVGPINP